MNINWFTVVAQLLNFLVLVALLKRFLYKPILNAIEERERKIETQLKEAEIKQKEAIKEQESFKQKNEEIDRARKEMLSKYQSEAELERIKLMDEARAEMLAIKNKWKDSFVQEQNEMNQQISLRIHQEVFLLTQKVLTDLSSQNLNDYIVRKFLEQLEHMNEAEKLNLRNAMRKTDQPIIVKSNAELSPQIKDMFTALFNGFGKELKIQFEIDVSLLAGVELLLTGFKISWNFRDYLASIEADAKVRIENLLSQEVKVQQLNPKQ